MLDESNASPCGVGVKFSMFGKKGVLLTFKDSYKIIPSSLKDACKAFSVDNPKFLFPVLLNEINYIGTVPDKKFFSQITESEYNAYVDSFKGREWSFKTESVKYCNADCKALFQVVEKFNKLTFEKFDINIAKLVSASALSFSILRSKFLDESTHIAQLTGDIEEDIRKGFTGGAVDMYVPTIPDGPVCYEWDVNSLFPSQFAVKALPVGNPVFFEGDISNCDSNDKPFGFFYAEVTAPKDIIHPLIQLRVMTEGGVRTVAPVGSFKTGVFSEELYNAEKYGYTYKIIPC